MPLVYAMHELDDLELLKTAHKHQCALIAHGGLKEDSFKDVQTRAKDLFQDMINILHPWELEKSRSVPTDLIELFKRHFGDPNDPAVQERIKKQEEEAAVLAAQEEAKEAETKKKLEEFEQKLANRNLRKPRGTKK
jgi:hypothetical protein